MLTTDWHKLYKEGWQGEIVPDAFAHPAKYSRALIRHIYQHILAEGWVTAGDSICDPFGGVALGGLDAMRHGMHWYGCELEPKFVTLGNQNIEKWNAQYAGHFPKWGSATLVQGDSRELSAVLSKHLGAMRAKCGGFEAAVSSPPFSQPETRDRSPVQSGEIASFMQRAYTVDRQGTSAGNIAPLAGDDFWTAARAIVEQVYMVLKPGGHATWVVKSFVKNKQIVDFPGRWQQLCEAVGFETLHYHRAWMVENRGAQYGLFDGELHTRTVERKSFFRRLAESKGSPRIDYKIVLCMAKQG